MSHLISLRSYRIFKYGTLPVVTDLIQLLKKGGGRWLLSLNQIEGYQVFCQNILCTIKRIVKWCGTMFCVSHWSQLLKMLPVFRYYLSLVIRVSSSVSKTQEKWCILHMNNPDNPELPAFSPLITGPSFSPMRTSHLCFACC